ncbi:MAG: hypothetical protein WCL51_11230 [Bacteroidota bacterium]
MISLDVLTENFWKNLHCSHKRFRLFVEDCIVKDKASGIPEIVDLLTDTNPIVKFYSDEINLLDATISDQRVATALKNIVYADYQVAIRGLEGAVIDVFKGKKSIQYTTEFFTHGLGEYSDMTEHTAQILFTRTELLTTKYVTQLGIPRQTLFADLLASYTATHSAQQLAIAKVVNCNAAIKKKVIDVKDIMFRNILKIAAYYYKTPGEVKNFYNETVLHCRHKNKNGEPIEKAYEAIISKLSVLLADISYTKFERLLFENLGTESLYYFTSDTELEVVVIPEDAIELISGEEKIVETSSLKTFLYIANKSEVKGKIQLSAI